MGKAGVFSLLFRPLHKIGKPKNPDIRLVFDFYSVQCDVKYTAVNSALHSDEWMTVAFLHYFGRYLMICDQRQRQSMSTLLPILANCTSSEDTHMVAEEVYADVLETLSDEERGASSGLFGAYPPTWLKTDDTISDRAPFTTYGYSMSMTEKGIFTHLELGHADMILFPLSVCHLYAYIIDNFNNEKSHDIAKRALNDLQELYYTDNQDLSWLKNGPIKVVSSYPTLKNAVFAG